MKFQSCYFSIFVLTVVFVILPPISAPWTKDDPPKTPDSNEKKYCYEWIIYNGFDETDVKLNKSKAADRDPKLDGDTFLWSTGYAYACSFTKSPPKPNEFCTDHKVNTEDNFLALKNASRTCPDWIFLYGYEIENYHQNWKAARSRDVLADDDIPHFVAGYGQQLSIHNENVTVSPVEYCSGLGLSTAELFPFMTRNTSDLNCADWIKMHGYTDDKDENYFRAKQGFNTLYLSQIHYWAKRFATYIYSIGYPSYITPMKFCSQNITEYLEPIPFFAYIHPVRFTKYDLELLETDL